MRILLILLAIVAIIVIGLFVRDQIRKTRGELKHVDRSKLKNLDDDGWDDDDDWGSKS